MSFTTDKYKPQLHKSLSDKSKCVWPWTQMKVISSTCSCFNKNITKVWMSWPCSYWGISLACWHFESCQIVKQGSRFTVEGNDCVHLELATSCSCCKGIINLLICNLQVVQSSALQLTCCWFNCSTHFPCRGYNKWGTTWPLVRLQRCVNTCFVDWEKTGEYVQRNQTKRATIWLKSCLAVYFKNTSINWLNSCKRLCLCSFLSV